MEVKRLQAVQQTKAEAEWIDPSTGKLNQEGLAQWQLLQKTMKQLQKLEADLTYLAKSRNQTLAKGGTKHNGTPEAGHKRQREGEQPGAKGSAIS